MGGPKAGKQGMGMGNTESARWTVIGAIAGALRGALSRVLTGALTGVLSSALTGVFAGVLMGALLGSWPHSGAAAVSFVRGDVDAGGSVDLSDAVGIFNHLFLGAEEPPCLAAADADDSGSVDITDGIYLLNYLFLGGPAPAAPFPACARHDEWPGLKCLHFEACRTVDVAACEAAGGTTVVWSCCQSVSDFPGLCVIGPCGCAPWFSHEIWVCDCGEGLCWDGTACVERQ